VLTHTTACAIIKSSKRAQGRKPGRGRNKMEYTREAAERIYKEVFGIKSSMNGQSALGSYRNMMGNIKLNYSNEIETMANKLNSLIMPYFEDIKANPGKVL
jgi:hypothetical protein